MADRTATTMQDPGKSQDTAQASGLRNQAQELGTQMRDHAQELGGCPKKNQQPL